MQEPANNGDGTYALRKGQSVGATSATANSLLKLAHYEAAARDWLRARGDAVTPEAVARIAREIRAEHEASAQYAQARRVENEKMSAGNRKARRAAYARARRAGA